MEALQGEILPRDKPYKVEFEALSGSKEEESGGTTDEESNQEDMQDGLPSCLLEDPNFRDYVSRLNRKPNKSDYILCKIAMIGDRIDKNMTSSSTKHLMPSSAKW